MTPREIPTAGWVNQRRSGQRRGYPGSSIEKHGVPRALYMDWKNVYKREPTERERLRGKAPTTHFGRVCEQLEIGIMAANSPQAKGRVERNNGDHQDRLVTKLRRKGTQVWAGVAL